MTAWPRYKPMLRSYTFFLCFCAVPLASAETSWTLAKERDGIKIYTREVANSPLREFKGEVVLETSTDKILKILKDPDSFARWMPDVVVSRTLSKSENTQYYYLEIASPWPVSNRDGVYRFDFAGLPDAIDAVNVIVHAAPDYSPQKDGKVRVPRSDGVWSIRPFGGGVSVSYQMNIDPGGSIPAWMANTAVVDTPFKTLQGLRTYVQSQK